MFARLITIPGDSEALSCLRNAVLKHKAFFLGSARDRVGRLPPVPGAVPRLTQGTCFILTPGSEEGGESPLFYTIRGEAGVHPPTPSRKACEVLV